MTIESLLASFAWSSSRLGLDTSRLLLQKLGNPQEQVPVIHVAGSNGKGSVCAFLSSILVEAGLQVGRYTSPHLIDWNERICLNNEPISTGELRRSLEKVISIAQTLDDAIPSQFELITAVAWLYFAQKNVDVAVIEVGLGGRLDATNVCDRPLVSIITSISREHWQVLGSTLGEIAREKAGILKLGCPAVIGQVPPEAGAVIYRRAAELGCETTYPIPAKAVGDGWVEYCGIEEYELIREPSLEFEEDDDDYAEWSEEDVIDLDETVLIQMMTTLRYRLPLEGAIQQHNSALAIAAIQTLRERGWDISDTAIVDGIAKTRWLGRLQWIQWCDRPILIDGAHNPGSAVVLREYVDSLQVKPISGNQTSTAPSATHWIMGTLATKDHAEMFTALLRSGDSLSLVPVPDPKTADPETLAELARKLCPTLKQCHVYSDVIAAVEAAIVGEDRVVVCGSLYLIGHFLHTLQPSI